MNLGEHLVFWSARFAMLFYVLALAGRLQAKRTDVPQRRSRAWWSIGCVMMILHIGFAMHYYHDDSLAKTYEDILQQTRERTGVDWGGGLAMNYVFIALWFGDALAWRFQPIRYQNRSWLWEGPIQAYLGFMAFNATVVFGAGISRWGGIAACAWLLALGWNRRQAPG